MSQTVALFTFRGRNDLNTGKIIYAGVKVKNEEGNMFVGLGSNSGLGAIQKRIPVIPKGEKEGKDFALFRANLQRDGNKIILEEVATPRPFEAQLLLVGINPKGKGRQVHLTGIPNSQPCPYRNQTSRAKKCSCGIEIIDGTHPDEGEVITSSSLDPQKCQVIGQGQASASDYSYPVYLVKLTTGAKFCVDVVEPNGEKIVTYFVSAIDDRLHIRHGEVLSVSDADIDLNDSDFDLL